MDGPAQNTNRNVQWKSVILNQDWASIFVNFFLVVALIIVTQLNDVADRSFLNYDATISYIYNPNSTIPAWLAGVVPLVSLILSLAVLEIGFAPRFGFSLTSAIASSLHWIIDFSFAAVTNSLLTEVTKLLVGRYRPDWLSRCQPDDSTGAIVPSWGLPAASNPPCTSDLPQSKLDDGHKSFPSGHSSTAFSLGVYVAGYVLWAVFYRVKPRYAYNPSSMLTLKERIVMEMGTALAFLWVVFQLSWAWGVAVSRVIDNKHHPSDVVAASFLGTVIGGAFLLRSIPRHYIVMEEPRGGQVPLLECGAESGSERSTTQMAGMRMPPA